MAEAITATPRSEFGKGAARRTRRAGLIPAVLYGHGTDPVHLSLPGHETFLIVKHTSNALLELAIEGGTELALVKDVQKDVVTNEIEHIDLLLVRRGEKVTVDVDVVTEGESYPGTIHSVELQTLTVEALATNIPTQIVVDITDLEDGAIVRVSDLVLPEGTTTEIDDESPVVLITVPRASAQDEADEAAVEAAAAAASAASAAAAEA
ncbi:50S ribosomal protein L25 [Serinibacter arcticus]|uniref:Large ribosomal subunit protein bL25 n=1 Tax=Serinibacter arcticus TaxID=1655435 RepID=A0A2U1ZYC0_9MICO|nr:50S ribosomal protein L25/general stress protein Ctc [Serinibacter arcticus]PWD51979.1 50S ribosomal protein L25 [Serinibacter arcticus]